MEIDDGLFLPLFQPPVAGHQAVVLVDFAVAFLPVVELTGAETGPGGDPPGRNFRAAVPVTDVIDDLVAGVVGNPASFQRSPSSFFNCTCSSSSSATTSFLSTILASSAAILRC